MTAGPPSGTGGLWSSAPMATDPRPPTGAKTKPPRPTSDPSRNLLRAAGVLALLLIAVVVNAALNDEEGLNPIALAADRIGAETGARLSVEAIYTAPSLPGSVVAKGDGVYNARSRRSRVRLELPIPGTGTVRVESVGDDHTVYVRGFGVSAGLPPGRRWIAFDPMLGRDDATAIGGSGDTQSQLEMMRAVSGDVEKLGEDEVRGVKTTGYRGEVDLARLSSRAREEGNANLAELYERYGEQGQGPVVIEAWVDGGGIARRLRVETALPGESGQPALTMDMRIEFYDFGGNHPVRLPRPGEVFDMTPIVRAETHLIDGSTFLGTWRRNGAPLTAMAFRARANEICMRLEHRFDAIDARAKPELEAIERVTGGAPDPDGLKRAMQSYASVVEQPLIGTGRRMLRQLQSLRPPASLAGRFHRMVTIGARQFELGIAGLRSFQIGAATDASRYTKEGDRLQQVSERLASQLGLPACIEEDSGDGGGAAGTAA